MRGATVSTDAGDAGSIDCENTIGLRQFGIGVLELCGALYDHVNANAVTHGHLIDETTEIPLQLSDLLIELVAPSPQVNRRLLIKLCRTV